MKSLASRREPAERLPPTIYLLSLCNACQFTSASLLITISALIGFDLSPDKRLATLPLALQFLAIMSAGVPASLFMGRFGRKPGFLLGSGFGIIGASIALWAIVHDSFRLYCLATVFFGSFIAFANYYRFTAAEVVGDTLKSRAISMVMAGGVVAAFLGPNLAGWSDGLITSHRFAGPFIVLVGVFLISMAAIGCSRLPPPVARSHAKSGRSLGAIMRQPIFVVAVLCQMLGYGTMNLVMTATPLAMQANQFDLSAMAFVIQWHVLGMFAPSFFTGHLIRRVGIDAVLLAGVVFGFVAVLLNLSGQTLMQFTPALVLLGLCWNFLFIGGTTLLTDAYSSAEKTRSQAANDLFVFSTVSITALCAGGIHQVFGWQAVNYSVLPLLTLAGLAIGWLIMTRHRARRSGGAVRWNV